MKGKSGYLNLFSDDCCFIGDNPDNFRVFKPGDTLYTDEPPRELTLRCEDGEWALCSQDERLTGIQGMRVRIE